MLAAHDVTLTTYGVLASEFAASKANQQHEEVGGGGSAVAGVPGLPAHLRGLFISMLHVFCRLRAEAVDLSTPEALLGYLDETCEGLLDQLRAEWWQDGVWQTGADGRKPRLREAYTKDATLAWQRAGVVLEN